MKPWTSFSLKKSAGKRQLVFFTKEIIYVKFNILRSESCDPRKCTIYRHLNRYIPHKVDKKFPWLFLLNLFKDTLKLILLQMCRWAPRRLRLLRHFRMRQCRKYPGNDRWSYDCKFIQQIINTDVTKKTLLSWSFFTGQIYKGKFLWVCLG